MATGHEASSGLTLALVGAGKMGTAVLSGILSSVGGEAPFSQYVACVQSSESVKRLQDRFEDHSDHLTILQHDNLKAFQDGDVIILGFKPYMAQKILSAAGVREALRRKLIISLLAGITSEKLLSYIYGHGGHRGHTPADACRIARATPNMAASIGESMTIIESQSFPTELVHWIFSQVGQVRYVSPDLVDAAGSLVGAGIAFMTVAFEGLLDGSVSEGIKRDEAKEMLAQTLLGMAKLLAAGEHPAILREQITSPRGTTIRGLLALEAGSVRSNFSRAIIDATERAREL